MVASYFVIASILIGIAAVSGAENTERTPLISRNMVALASLDAHLEYRTDQGNQHLALKPTNVSISREPEQAYRYSNLTLTTDDAEIVIVLVSRVPNQEVTRINHIWVNFKQPIEGYNSCLVNSVYGFIEAQHVRCDVLRRLDCYGYTPESSGKASILSKFATLVIDFLEYEIVKDYTTHRNLKYFKEATEC